MNNRKIDELLAELAQECGLHSPKLAHQIVWNWAKEVYKSGYDTGHYFGHSEGYDVGFADGAYEHRQYDMGYDELHKEDCPQCGGPDYGPDIDGDMVCPDCNHIDEGGSASLTLFV